MIDDYNSKHKSKLVFAPFLVADTLQDFRTILGLEFFPLILSFFSWVCITGY